MSIYTPTYEIFTEISKISINIKTFYKFKLQVQVGTGRPYPIDPKFVVFLYIMHEH